MKKTMIWLIVGLALVLIGGCVFVGVLAAGDWDFSRLSTEKYHTVTHTVSAPWNRIFIDSDTADITLLPSADGGVRVVCYEEEKLKHSVTVEGETLTVRVVDTRRWYEHIGIFGGSPKITLYLPAGEYAALTVREDTGDIDIPRDFSFASLDLMLSTGDVRCAAAVTGTTRIESSTGDVHCTGAVMGAVELITSTGDVSVVGVTVESLRATTTTGRINLSALTCRGVLLADVSTGKVTMTDVTCDTLTTNGSTGDLALHRVLATSRFSITRDTGDVRFEACDAAEIVVKTDTGDVEGSFRTEKIVYASTDTGRVEVPRCTGGGRCEITTDTGDIRVSILPAG